MRSEFEVIVIGAGHSGCEAALAAARMGCRTAVLTFSKERIAHMPCNCSIGGPAKGQLTREVDALGGQMAINTDLTLTHIRAVGTRKGPAIQTLRAHADKNLYPKQMRLTLETQENLTVIEDCVEKLLMHEGQIAGVQTANGDEIAGQKVIITTGTFLNGLIHIGEIQKAAGRYGEPPSVGLADSLQSLGLKLGRFKTGTTPRISKPSIDFSVTEAIGSDVDCSPFSFMHDKIQTDRELLPCWQTHTTEQTHEIVRRNLNRSALYGGRIKGVGPRYCPSIEDKVVRFPDKLSHPVFFEQEEWNGDSIYVQGMSTSLPEEIQIEFLKSLPGLADVVLLRPGYAVEYDMVHPNQLDHTLMSREHPGLYFAGQINGTSGYEEAAAQGLMAGINAALAVQKRDPLTLDRASSYIGVMIDDLITKGVEDPYRMLTARAEYRLSLRHDNADQRLTPISHEIGLCTEKRWERYKEKTRLTEIELIRLRTHHASGIHNLQLSHRGSAALSQRISLLDLLRRPEMSHKSLCEMFPPESPVRLEVAEQVEIIAKYEGYLGRQQAQVDQHRKLEHCLIPEEIDYHCVPSLSYESREKFSRIRPRSIGHASRIPGVRPSDIAVLLVYMKSLARQQAKSEETL